MLSTSHSQSSTSIGTRIFSLLWACRIVQAVALSLDLDSRSTNYPSTYNSSVNVTASGYPQYPDFITCNRYYGTELQDITCREALANFVYDPRHAYIQFTTKGPGGFSYPTYLVPLRRADHPDLPLCIMTIELAGQSNTNDPLGIATRELMKMASAVIDQCPGRWQTGGFGTFQLSKTVSGMANAQPAPHGYDAPKFLTVSFTGTGSYWGPGNFDPDVNEHLQIALQKKYNSAIFQRTKDKIAIVINALAAVYGDMRRSGQKAWWDNTHYEPEIPQGVSNLCRRLLGHPNPTDCERASFNFIKSGPTTQIKQGSPIQFISGSCMFEVSAEDEPIATTWDMLRSVADSLMNECLLAPGSQMTGGEANYIGLAQNASGVIDLSSRSSAEDSSSDTNTVRWPRGLVLTMKENPNRHLCAGSNDTAQCSPDTISSGAVLSPGPVGDVPTS